MMRILMSIVITISLLGCGGGDEEEIPDVPIPSVNNQPTINKS